MNGKFYIFLFFCLTLTTKAQNKLTVKEVIQRLQTDPRFEDGGADWVQFEEQLLQLQYNTVSLNTASLQELKSIPFLDEFAVFQIMQYRRSSGTIYSYYELNNIPGFSEGIMEILPLFTNLNTRKQKVNFKHIFKYGHQTFAARSVFLAQKPRGFTDTNAQYLGHSTSYYGRYRLNYYNKIFIGFTLQNDAGEKTPTQFPYVSDYASFHIELRFDKTIQKIIVGDFYANYGQGLALWSALAYGKTAQTIETQRYGKGIGYYSSAEENRFFRGAAIQFKKDQFTLDAFASANNTDVTLTGNGLAQTFVTNGLHRSVSELEKKDNQNIKAIGGHLGYFGNHANLGFTAYHYQFKIPFAKSTEPYKVHQFGGKQNTVLSVDYNLMFKKSIWYGEVGFSVDQAKTALLAGFKITPVDLVKFTATARSIPSGYHTLYNAPFSESGNAGEQGIYFGMELKLPENLTFNGYVDRYKFDWLKFANPQFNTGQDYLMQLTYNPNYKVATYLRYRVKTGTESIAEGNLYLPADFTLQNWRLNFRYNISAKLTWSTRLEYKRFNFDQTGIIMYQDLSIKPFAIPLAIDFRLSVFNTETFENAMYAREDDLPYSYNLALFNDRGLKHYLMLKYSFKKLDFWFRYAYLWYPNKTSIGTGYDEIASNNQTVFKVMVRLNL